MTQTATVKYIRGMGLACRVQNGEYRINLRGARGSRAYHTSDPSDAIQTAIAIKRDGARSFPALRPEDQETALMHAQRLAAAHGLAQTVLQDSTPYVWFEYRHAYHAAASDRRYLPIVTALPPRYFE